MEHLKRLLLNGLAIHFLLARRHALQVQARTCLM